MSDSESSNTEAPKIEFPCPNYPIKVMGTAGDVLKSHVIEVFKLNCPEFDANSVTVKPSRHGRFESVGVVITAQSKDHLQKIFDDLKKSPTVKMVL